MTSSFTDYMTKTAAAVAAVETVIQDAPKIYSKLAELVVAAENAFAGLANAGSTKKAIVMAGISVFVAQLGQAWDAIKDMLSSFIDAAISAYRAVMSVVTTPAVPQS